MWKTVTVHYVRELEVYTYEVLVSHADEYADCGVLGCIAV